MSLSWRKGVYFLSDQEQRSPQNIRYPILGMDISQTKIGLAIAEHPDVMPQSLFTYIRITRARDLAQCTEWIRRYGVGAVVLGLPLNMDGTQGPRARWMQRFCRELQERVDVPVVLQDERLSTVEADTILTDRGLNRTERADQVDAVAAALILERFLHER
jgi:putative Holliday junction resolvase